MKPSVYGMLFIVFAVTVVSCDECMFNQPQPVDGKNIYKFPKVFHGTWAHDSDTIIVDAMRFSNIQHRLEQISVARVDTSPMFKLSNGRLFIIKQDMDEKVWGGYKYTEADSTITYRKREVFDISLGYTAFIRKVGPYWLLNNKRDNGWWDVVLLESTKDGRLLARTLDKDDLPKMKGVKEVFTRKYEHYLEAAITMDEMESFVKAGCFSDTLYNLNASERVKK